MHTGQQAVFRAGRRWMRADAGVFQALGMDVCPRGVHAGLLLKTAMGVSLRPLSVVPCHGSKLLSHWMHEDGCTHQDRTMCMPGNTTQQRC